MPVANTKNLSASALAYLTTHAGKRFDSAQVARYFDAPLNAVRATLIKLTGTGKVCSVTKNRRLYFFVEDRASSNMAMYTPPPAWKMPPSMLERVNDIRAQREAFPSKHV